MLKPDAKERLKAILKGVDIDKLLEAAKAEVEADFAIPELKTYTDEELTARDGNTKAEAVKEAKKEGKKDGIGIANKVIADKFGLKDIDLTNPDKVVDALSAHFNGGDQALKDQVKLLQDQVKTTLTEKEAAIKQVQEASFDRDLLTMFPQNRASTLTDNEYLTLLKGQLSFETNEGVTLVKKGGEVLRDATTKNPIPVKDAIASVFGERKWITESGNGGGRGAGDNQNQGSGGIKTASKFMDKWVSEGKNPMSAEYQTALQQHAKTTTDFNMNE